MKYNENVKNNNNCIENDVKCLVINENDFDNDGQRSKLLTETTLASSTTTTTSSSTESAETCLTTTTPPTTTTTTPTAPPIPFGDNEADGYKDIDSITLVDESNALYTRDWFKVYDDNNNSNNYSKKKFKRHKLFLIGSIVVLLVLALALTMVFNVVIQQKSEKHQVNIDHLENKLYHVQKQLNVLKQTTTMNPRARKDGDKVPSNSNEVIDEYYLFSLESTMNKSYNYCIF